MRNELAVATTRLLWGQWTALGVAGTASIPDHAIDLEALISLTPSLRHEDPRLYDEALDWCISHSQRLISTGRLRSLRQELPAEACAAYDDFAAYVNATARPKPAWPTLGTAPPLRTSGKSRSPEIRQPPLLQLQLRCLFGVSARADVLMQFLRPGMTHEGFRTMAVPVSALTDIGYSKPALGDVLASLTMAGLLEKWRRGNRDYYELSRVAALQALVGGVLPRTAPNWALRFRVVAGLLFQEAATREKKPVVQAVAIQRELERHRDVLERLSLKPPARTQDWAELARWAEATLLDGESPHG